MHIGLTGGIASGKSTVAQMLVKRGALLVDADQIAREVVEPGHPVLDRVVAHFGQAVLHRDGSLNRKKLGEIIFADKAEKNKLEAILHPAIRAMMKQRKEKLETKYPSRLVVVDVPLLYESNLASMFAEVWLVYITRELQIERLMKRNEFSKEEALSRIEAQMPIDEKKKMADVIIDNCGSLQQTEAQVEAIWKRKGLG